MTFRIKEAREAAGYTQKELAELIGVAPNTFHGYESGKHDPKSDLLIKIARECRTTVDFLLGMEKETAPITESPATEAEMLECFQELESVLVKKGYISPGEDISEQDADFLITLLDLIDSYFQKRT